MVGGFKISELLAGTGFLIGMYLLLNNARSTTNIISQLGSTYSQGVKTLQGR